MNEEPDISPPVDKQILPDSPEITLFLALAAERLGCSFSISERMLHGLGIPMCFHFLPKGRPQFSDAKPHERFRNDDEVFGAIKLITYYLSRLSDADADFLWTLFGQVHIDNRKPFDFREMIA